MVYLKYTVFAERAFKVFSAAEAISKNTELDSDFFLDSLNYLTTDLLQRDKKEIKTQVISPGCTYNICCSSFLA